MELELVKIRNAICKFFASCNKQDGHSYEVLLHHSHQHSLAYLFGLQLDQIELLFKAGLVLTKKMKENNMQKTTYFVNWHAVEQFCDASPFMAYKVYKP